MTAAYAQPLRQQTAPPCLAIKVVTGIVLAADAGLLAASFFLPHVLPALLILALITVICYRTAPVAFELEGGSLVVTTRSGQRTFANVASCSRLDRRPPFTLRVWGNGGLFAGTGYYWNRQWGLFRAYVTAGSYEDYVLVETGETKVLISPEDPAAFVDHCSGGKRS